MTSVATTRLAEERKSWRKDHPLGFVAKPATKPDGSVDMFHWRCEVPGKEGTLWEGGVYPVEIVFPSTYPTEPPRVRFPRGFKHPNVFDTGDVCLSIIGKAWKPGVSVKQILCGLQELLADPNNLDPADWDVHDLYARHRAGYDAIVRAQAQRYARRD
ncbi:hypothetical protein N2152v2_005526 [Parachlorella kessleri]